MRPTEASIVRALARRVQDRLATLKESAIARDASAEQHVIDEAESDLDMLANMATEAISGR